MGNEAWVEVWHVLHETLMTVAETLHHQTIVELYDAAEQTCLKLVGTSEHDRLEVKRRIVEQKMLALFDRDVPFKLVDELYRDLKALGFSGLYQEMTYGSCYAQFCFRQGEQELGTGILLELLTRLRAVRDDVSAAFFDENREHIEDLLLKHGAKPPPRFL